MRISPTALAALSLLLMLQLAPVAAAQCNAPPAQSDSLAGPWWFKLAGKDEGAILLEFTAPKGGAFSVTNIALTGRPSFGFSRLLEDFFQIDEETSELGLDSKGNVTGTLELVDTGGLPVGTIALEKGKPNKTFTKLKLRGTLACKTCTEPVVVKLTGSRPPAGFPVLTGRTTAGKLKGKGVKSQALDLEVDADDELGPPAYAWLAEGSAQIDGEDEMVSLDGRVMLDPGFKAWGRALEDSAFAKGKLSVADPNNPVPKLGLTLQPDTGKLKLKAKLTEAVQPILLVSPTSFAFGAVRLGDSSAEHTFTVENVGSGSLSGVVSFLAPTSDFSADPNEYGPLGLGDAPEEIAVHFDPLTAGAKSASLCFGVDGGAGSVVVALTGSGGIGELSADPDPVAFDDTAIGQSQLVTVTVTNTGDIPVSGQASLSTSLAFQLMKDNVPAALPIGYDLDPDEAVILTIRFQPTVAGAANATLTLTGPTAGSKSVTVTGTATSP